MKKYFHTTLSYIKNPLTISIICYITSLFFLNPWGEYAVNDDWDFITHVKNFMQGDFTKNSLIDSSFVLQGIIGMLWSKMLGLSFNNLRILSIIISTLCLVGIFKILKDQVSNTMLTITLLTISFNPFFYISSVTFMTENYFFLFFIWSVYFYLKYLKDSLFINVFIAAFLAGLSILIRQFGIILLFALLIHQFLIWLKSKNIRGAVILLLSLVIFSLINFNWPQYNSDNESPFIILTKGFYNLLNMGLIASNFFYLLPYLGFAVIPFGLISFSKLNYKFQIIISILSAFLFNFYFKFNIFKLGNVLYPQGLLIKSDPPTNLTLFDNNIFKSLLLIAILISLFSVATIFLRNYKNTYKNPLIKFWGLLTLIFILLILPFEGFDRYYYYGLILFTIFIAIQIDFQNENKTKSILGYTTLIIYCFFVFSITHTYISLTKEKWVQAKQLRQQNDVGNKIYLSGTYTKYMSVFNKKNSAEIVRATPLGIKYICYIQEKIEINNTNFLYDILRYLNFSRFMNQFIPNPAIYNSEYQAGYRKPTNDKNRILFDRDVISIPNNILGVRVHVITYCLD